jgi:hypothetical protein
MHKASVNKRIEITSHILSDHNGMKLEMNIKKKYRKYTNTWKLKNILLNDH